jgi:hypothetical protein
VAGGVHVVAPIAPSVVPTLGVQNTASLPFAFDVAPAQPCTLTVATAATPQSEGRSEDMLNWKLPELKDECCMLGVKISGTKPQLDENERWTVSVVSRRFLSSFDDSLR